MRGEQQAAVHGATTAKIKSYGMDTNPYYGVLSQVPTYRIRQVLNYLQLEGYLSVTNDDYAIVKLAVKSKEVMEGGRQLRMKLAKAPPRPKKKHRPGTRKTEKACRGKGDLR